MLGRSTQHAVLSATQCDTFTPHVLAKAESQRSISVATFSKHNIFLLSKIRFFFFSSEPTTHPPNWQPVS